MAAKEPSSIEAMETKTTICCHCVGDAGKGHDRDAHEHGDAGDLRRGGEERRHRRRRALIDVGRPHMERHRGDLEAEAGEQKHQAEDQPDAAHLPPTLRDAGEADRAGEAVDQRRAVEQHSRRQRAEHEIFQPRFGRAQRVAVARGDHIERQAHQFEAEIERDQIVGRDQHQHAERREHDQHGIFEPLLLFAAGHSRSTSAMAAAEPTMARIFRKRAKPSTTKLPPKRHQLARGQQQHDHAGDDKQHDRGGIDRRPSTALAAKDAEHQQRHGAERRARFPAAAARRLG